MKNRMNLQLFEDGGGAGSGSQGGNAGGTGNQGTFSFAQAEEIANARADITEGQLLENRSKIV